ncbi:MAG: amidohydrolase [Peptoniphilaceae bacterium]|nr:amidohydrolase [Peptoniphilaceae bacterium]MDY6019557.1 amidohydrolase [Anaerococcus sp.]
MATNENIRQLAKKHQVEGCTIRDYLHQNPELSEHEYQTSKYLKEKCKDLGLLVEEVPNSTGFTALLDTGKEGKTLGIRTDIDALPINEDPKNLKTDKKIISQKENIMHACGHDVHMAIALTTAKILKDIENKFSGKIYFIFEEGEETGGGIDAMVKHLKDKSLDGVYGNHVDPELETGKFAINKGSVYAGCGGIDFDVLGKGGHGSRPDLCKSPLIGAVNIINALNSAWNNKINQKDLVTLGIGAINGGFASNVIPDTCNVKATFRFFDKKVGEETLGFLKEIVEAASKINDCKVRFNPYTRIVAKPTSNDIELADFARNSLLEIFEDSLVEKSPSFGSESFSGYEDLAPIVFVKLGIKNEKLGTGASAHTPKFDIDPDVIYYGSSLAAKFAYEFLTR